MPSNMEIRTTQKSVLFDLLEAEKEKRDIKTLIKKLKATMEAEDVAYVEKILHEET